MTSTHTEVWLDGRWWPREPPARERWALWGVEITTFLPILAELLAGTAPRWYGWVLIGIFAFGPLRYALGRLRHAAAVIDAMPLDDPESVRPRPDERSADYAPRR